MSNPTSVITRYETITTSKNTFYVTKYGYTSGSGMFQPDFKEMVEIYGAENVSTMHEAGRNWIVVSQPKYIEVEA